MNGGRKLADARETLLALTLGVIVCAWLKADPQLYFGFAAAAVGKSGVFNWGNAQEHKAKAAQPA
jgi:hypothetical protein